MIKVTEAGPLHETRQAITQALLLAALRQHELIDTAGSANAQLQAEVTKHRQLEHDANLLTTEVSHRVKNNLQVIVALIINEIKRTPAPWVHGYQAMQDRVAAIAHLYDLISQSSRGNVVALDDYVAEICRSLSASLLGEASCVRIAVEAEALEIESERAAAFGLLINELCTNAVKHAFPNGVGLVTVSLMRRCDDIELRVKDDGIGLPPQGQNSAPGKHGSDYVAVFVRQLRGAIVRSGAPGVGTTVMVRFPAVVGRGASLANDDRGGRSPA